MASVLAKLRDLEVRTRPEHPDLTAALATRWDELPEHVKTRNQMLGRRTAGCEGTHGVFPRCDLACTPCYHAKEANRVRVDGEHTVREIDSQMAMLRELRGPGQYAQLIGGEVTLLEPDDHAAALQTMIDHGRKPMSMSHGDFDYDYLEALALDPTTGRPRFKHLSFAGHFDSMMFGRRGIKAPPDEASLNPHRRAFCEMFQRLEREHGVTHYLAHNMTVTPGNIGEVAQVIRDCRDMGFRMFSFQPAAFIGNTNRWKHDYREFSTDEVWRQVEAGAGGRLHWNAFQIGDPRCNRTAYGAYCGDRYARAARRGRPARRAGARRLHRQRSAGWTSRRRLLVAAPRARARAPSEGIEERARLGAAVRRARRRGARAGARPPARDHLRDARLHGRRQGEARLGAAPARRDVGRARDPRDPGAPAGLLLRDGAPRVRRAGARLRPALGARPAGEPAPHRGAAAGGAPDGERDPIGWDLPSSQRR